MKGLELDYRRCKTEGGTYHEDMQGHCDAECAHEPVPQPAFEDKTALLEIASPKASPHEPDAGKLRQPEKVGYSRSGAKVPVEKNDGVKGVRNASSAGAASSAGKGGRVASSGQADSTLNSDMRHAELRQQSIIRNFAAPHAAPVSKEEMTNNACCCIHPPPSIKAIARSHPIDYLDEEDVKLCGDQGGSARDDIVPPDCETKCYRCFPTC